MENNNMYTFKEAVLLSDILEMEAHACKKARLYARTLTDANLAERFQKIADEHQARFNEILESL